MSEIDRYLLELQGELRATGAARRRILAECADHLRESAAHRGEADAVERFGPARELAAAFDAELAATRGRHATLAAVAAIAVIAAATLALARATPTHTSAPRLLIAAFFVSAQVAAVAIASAAVQALRWRHTTPSARTLAVLARRNAAALAAASVTIVAAALIVRTPHAGLMLGGGLLALAGAAWTARRAARLARELASGAVRAPASPLDDLVALCAPWPVARRPIEMVRDRLDPVRHPVACCAAVAVVAALAAFARDHGEGATRGQALVWAAAEATAVVASFVLLGRPLGLRA